MERSRIEGVGWLDEHHRVSRKYGPGLHFITNTKYQSLDDYIEYINSSYDDPVEREFWAGGELVLMDNAYDSKGRLIPSMKAICRKVAQQVAIASQGSILNSNHRGSMYKVIVNSVKDGLVYYRGPGDKTSVGICHGDFVRLSGEEVRLDHPYEIDVPPRPGLTPTTIRVVNYGDYGIGSGLKTVERQRIFWQAHIAYFQDMAMFAESHHEKLSFQSQANNAQQELAKLGEG